MVQYRHIGSYHGRSSRGRVQSQDVGVALNDEQAGKPGFARPLPPPATICSCPWPCPGLSRHGLSLSNVP
jgi:hypothetical protein